MQMSTPDDTDQDFFRALVSSNIESLDRLLADDFILVDVMTGSEVTKADFLDVMRGGALVFERVDRVEFRVRVFRSAAVVNGRTEMSGLYAGKRFGVSSRYTHVFIDIGGLWQMVAAQGTQIAATENAP